VVACLALTLSFGGSRPATAQDAAPDGERIGRQALLNHFHNTEPAPALDPDLDALARDQLRAAIDSGAWNAHLVRVAPDTVVRIGVVAPVSADARADVFSLVGPSHADAVGSAGGVAGSVEVGAAAWRDSGLTDLDDLTATFGSPPRTQEELDAAAAQAWLDQENRARLLNGFPPELLARRNPVLDREAENILRGMRGEPSLPRLTEPPPGFDMPSALHANVRTCQPNCDPFWSAPARTVDLYRQTLLENSLSAALADFDFDLYTQQKRWLQRYWDSYRLFGVATHVRADQEVTANRAVVRDALESVIPGAADAWDPREYPVDIVVVGSDPWPTP
jgi:hypothetical protein